MTRLSVLDRSLVRAGQDPARALRETVRFARQAEELGYHRFWVSEHHSVPGIAGSAPTVLAAAVAAATTRIRVGTGGVMLPNHRPLVVAEQFGVLEALSPGRVDMGLGRSVGFTGGIRQALGHGLDEADDFAGRLAELLGYFTGKQTTYPGVHAWSAEGSRPEVFVLAMGAGAEIAAGLGLPLVIAATPRMAEAVAAYRASFRPSEWSAAPYVMIATNVAVAETRAAAERLQLPDAWSTAVSRTRGEFPPLSPAAEILALPLTDRERRALDRARAGQVHGTPADVAPALADLVRQADADEVLVTMTTFDAEERLDSYRRLAGIFGS
ncbi:LLM class flavin-dependent oxidoreductase [Nonomuraea sp. NBC_01738]|uniref:LLM class flavin-dependent oxidoreductase n=1 Tax=Nonomuraea sp. NBC_01738 TaxID=2976003 RepID=UPI002E0E4947|nr:LLM class flavin-dependent oxidoreductase [Nonomuraea sp. NBC_01738]